ncbi:UNVERIFIED_CONTAM: Retrovirus-related Pol polyprotein from transposon opus [Sesamum indicum]
MHMIAFLRNNVDMFAWDPSDFKGISQEVIVHRLNVEPSTRPVQQKKRTFGIEKNRITNDEVNKLLKAKYISEVQYTDWLSNMVVIPKSSGKWRMCIDFTDLNKACPKDPYPLTRIDVLIDSTAGIYCYNVMPFGLKNSGATYQRLVNKMSRNHIGKTMEVYVDDMLVKSQRPEDHLSHLEVAFAIMREYGMKLNPSKCTFRVGGGKFLGYMVSSRGIEANPEKIEAILQLKSPASIKDVQKLAGKLASLNHFISRSADRNLHFFKILRKSKEFKWTEECEQAFQELKKYLRTPSLLANPKTGDTLYLYLVVSENAVSSVLVREDRKIHNPVYYVSKMLQGAEKLYTSTEKLVLALVVTTRKLRSYFQSYRVVVLTNQPLKSILSRPEVSGRFVKWATELGEYDIDYQTRTSEKAQVLVDFVMEMSGESTSEQNTWMLHVDGSSNASNGGAGILIQGSKGVEIEIAAKLSSSTTNEAEYEALIMGLELAYEAGARALEVYTDSQLVAMQIEGSYETKEKTMMMYRNRAKSLMQRFTTCSIQQIPMSENDRVDALSKFRVLLTGIRNQKLTIMVKDRPAISEGDEVNTVETPCSWKDEITRYLRTEHYQECLDDDQARYVMREVHEGSCGNHLGAKLLAQKLTRQGYFWPTILKDTKEFVQKCENCQKYASQIHAPQRPYATNQGHLPFRLMGDRHPRSFSPRKNSEKIHSGRGRIRNPKDFNIQQRNAIPGKANNSLVQRVKGSVELHSGRSSLSERANRKIGEETQRVAAYDPTTNGEARTFDLVTVEEKREKAFARMLHHKGLIMRNSDKKLRKRELQIGDLVLKRVEVSKHVGKLDSGWEGPYKVVEIKKQGMYKLQDTYGKDLP